VKGQPCRYINGHTGRRGTPAERFALKVRKGEPGECWQWAGAKMRSGYGRFGIAAGNVVNAHRFAYEAEHGPIPPGMFVLHSCDNPSCVNPAHLRAGTHSENMAEMRARGRGRGRMSKPHPTSSPS
jgi:hypothetical protein